MWGTVLTLFSGGVITVLCLAWYGWVRGEFMAKPTAQKELIAVGDTGYTQTTNFGEKRKDSHVLKWFFYRQGDRRFCEFGGRRDAEVTAHELWEDDIRMWVECNHLPKWADPVAARIIQDSTK